MPEDSSITVPLGGVLGPWPQPCSSKLPACSCRRPTRAWLPGQPKLASSCDLPGLWWCLEEGSLSSPVVLLATRVSCWPCSLQVVSPVDWSGAHLLIAEVFDGALCLFEEESWLLSYFESFAGGLIVTWSNSEHQQRVCYTFPVIRPKTSCQAQHWFLLLGCRSRTEWDLKGLGRAWATSFTKTHGQLMF